MSTIIDQGLGSPRLLTAGYEVGEITVVIIVLQGLGSPRLLTAGYGNSLPILSPDSLADNTAFGTPIIKFKITLRPTQLAESNGTGRFSSFRNSTISPLTIQDADTFGACSVSAKLSVTMEGVKNTPQFSFFSFASPTINVKVAGTSIGGRQCNGVVQYQLHPQGDGRFGVKLTSC